MIQTVKNLPVMQETRVQSLHWEDPLEKWVAIPTPVCLPGKSQGQRNLEGYSPWGHTELDTTEELYSLTQSQRQAADFLATLVLYLWSS